ncbi:hypothetical protein AAMO2058_000176400, partial [Amorphochlora amoebiformis]
RKSPVPFPKKTMNAPLNSATNPKSLPCRPYPHLPPPCPSPTRPWSLTLLVPILLPCNPWSLIQLRWTQGA